jgi:hypothetical protein
MIQRKVLILFAYEFWPTLPSKLTRLRELMAPKTVFTKLETEVVHFEKIDWKEYGRPILEPDHDRFKRQVIPRVGDFDTVCLVIPQVYWKSPGISGFRGFEYLGVRFITVGGMTERDDAYFGPADDRTKENCFVHFLFHELKHLDFYDYYGQDVKVCPYDSKDDCEDPTHFYIQQGDIKGLIDVTPVRKPRNAEQERAYWLVYALNFIRRIFIKNQVHEPQIEATIAEEIFYVPSDVRPRQSKLEAWALAIEAHETGGNPKSLPARLNNPFAFRFASWQTKWGGIPHGSGYTQFPTYDKGRAAGKAFLKTAATVYGKRYNPAMTLYQFFSAYAPDSDQGPGLAKSKQYAEQVAARIGVSANIQIRNLV